MFQDHSQQYNQPNDFGNNGGYVPPQGNGAYQPNGKMPFYKTTKGIIIIALALVLVLGVVYWGYNNIFGFTKIDLAKNISLKSVKKSKIYHTKRIINKWELLIYCIKG